MEAMDAGLEPGMYEDGDTITTTDDESLGQVVGFWPSRDEPTWLIASGGGSGALYVPVSAISGFQPGALYLGVTRDEALNSGWDTPPPGAPAPSDVSAN